MSECDISSHGVVLVLAAEEAVVVVVDTMLAEGDVIVWNWWLW